MYEYIQSGPKSGTIFVYLITLRNTNRFLKKFYHRNQEQICYDIITINPTTPQVCCSSVLNGLFCANVPIGNYSLKCVATLSCEISMS